MPPVIGRFLLSSQRGRTIRSAAVIEREGVTIMARKSNFLKDGGWYKGNTHLHTTLSDGALEPAAAAAIYKEAGYAFLVMTDHWVYGNHLELQSDDFLLFAGMEMDVVVSPEQGFCHHVTVMADPAQTPYHMGDTLPDIRALGDMKTMVEQMNRSGHICIYAHPNWSHIDFAEYSRIDGCIGVEVYNHICEAGAGSGYGDAYYDRKLWTRTPCFCFASDDAHGQGHTLGGFIGVKAAGLTHRAIMDAIRAGSFYASTGPEILDFYVEDGQVFVECSPCSDITLYSDAFCGAHMVKDKPGTTTASCPLPANAVNIYVTCREGDGKAWSQPIWL